MIYRLLEPHEYSKLLGLGEMNEDLLPHPEQSIVVVAERDSQIVAFWVLQHLAHAEPVWIHPDHRNSTIGYGLWRRVRALLDASHTLGAFCCAETPEVAEYLLRLGFRELPMRMFVYEVEPCPC